MATFTRPKARRRYLDQERVGCWTSGQQTEQTNTNKEKNTRLGKIERSHLQSLFSPAHSDYCLPESVIQTTTNLNVHLVSWIPITASRSVSSSLCFAGSPASSPASASTSALEMTDWFIPPHDSGCLGNFALSSHSHELHPRLDLVFCLSNKQL